MSLVATVVDPLVEPPPAGWDEFVTAQRLLPAWDSRLLRLVDWCSSSSSSMVLVRESGSGAPVAAFHARHLGPARAGRFARPGRVPPFSLTECRAVPTLGAGIAFADELNQRDRAEAVRMFERVIRRRVGPGGRGIAYRHISTDVLAAASGPGRVRFRTTPNMVLENQWRELGGYLASLPRKLRGQFRKTRREVDLDETIVIGHSASIEPEEACWLANTVRRRHRNRTAGPPCPAGYFTRLGQLPGSRFLTYRTETGRLLAFVAMYDNGSELISGLWGSRPLADGGRRDLYFDGFLRQVEWLVQAGRDRLVLGGGMLDIKARFGARTEARWGLVGIR